MKYKEYIIGATSKVIQLMGIVFLIFSWEVNPTFFKALGLLGAFLFYVVLPDIIINKKIEFY